MSAGPKRWRKPTTKSDPRARFAPNYLNRECTAEQPNSKWVTETKAVETAEGWLYLAVILDLFSRMVGGWAMAATEDGALGELALRMAYARRHPGSGLLYHSDRGTEFTSDRYQAALRELGIEVSMSRTANCWENAAMSPSLPHSPKSVLISPASRADNKRGSPFSSTWSACIIPSVYIRRYTLSARLLLSKQLRQGRVSFQV